MYNNIGEKIKGVAKFLSVIGIVGSIIIGTTMIITMHESISWIGLIILIFGSLVSWILSFPLYGFGQLIENTDYLVALQTSSTPINTSEKEQALKQWKTEGLITEEEYNKKIEELHNENKK